jgi:O-antigen/teichoic acid export membrane protein
VKDVAEIKLIKYPTKNLDKGMIIMRAFLIGLFLLMFVAVAPEVFMALLNYIIVLIIILSIYLYIDHKLYLERKRERKEKRREAFEEYKKYRKRKSDKRIK